MKPKSTWVCGTFVPFWQTGKRPKLEERRRRSFRSVLVSDLRVSLNTSKGLEDSIFGIALPRDISEADLNSGSIPAKWLISGEARTRSKLLGRTQDRLAYAMYWECGAATFNWHYGNDEFMVILSGEVFVKSEDGGERRYGPSDFIFFPAGSEATWRVPDHIRKIAILKNSVNQSAIRISKVWDKLLELAGLSGKAQL